MLNKSLTKALIVFSVIALCTPSFASAWTVTELQKNAASQRYLVRDYQAALEQQQQSVRKQRGTFLPAVELYYQAEQLRDETIIQQEKTHSRGVELSWNLFKGFGDYYRLLSEKQQQQVADLQLQEIQQSVQQQVAQTCLNLHQQQQNLQVAQRQLSLYQQERQNAQAKFDVGLITRNEVLRIEVELENSQLDVNRAETIIQQQLAQLQRQTLTNVQLENLDLSEFSALPELNQLPQLQQQLLTNNRELQSLQTVIEAAQLDRKAARDTFLPRADLAATYQRGENELAMDDGDQRDEQLSAQLRLSINLFDGFKDDADLQRARIATNRATYRYQEREHELITELDNTYREFYLAVDNLQVAKTNRQQTEENLRITRVSFDQGLTTSVELLDAIFFQSRADFNIIEARSVIFAAQFAIEQLTGSYPDYSQAN